MKGKLMSFEHSINFNRVQNFSIHKSSSAVIYTKLIKRGGCVCFNESRFYQFCITAEADLRIETSCALLKSSRMLCSKLTNLPIIVTTQQRT